jgi:hypothetical protein
VGSRFCGKQQRRDWDEILKKIEKLVVEWKEMHDSNYSINRGIMNNHQWDGKCEFMKNERTRIKEYEVED